MKDEIQLGLLNKISKIIDELKIEYDIFEDVNKEKVLNEISKISSLNLDNISENELVKRIRGILAIEAMSGLLKDLSKKQIEIFNDDIK
ncbi:MAG TPA: hypothetical protein PLW61_03415 [Caldisericia bacterium]|nr:hypothetical protein [Caldisericia bacterium]HQN49154.1 hypothetical protein [Caldisericia bacterium]HQP00292.1 hypothetical protein [Caldisericia bacterium]